MRSLTEPAGSPRPPNRNRVYEIVRDVVAEIAPAELPLVDGLGALTDDAAVRQLRRRRRRREPLGFGLDQVVLLVTPVVWLVLDEVVTRGVNAAIDGTDSRARAWLRRRLRRPADPRTVPPLTREQITAVHRRVLDRSAEAGLTSEQAAALADGVVSRLARELPEETT